MQDGSAFVHGQRPSVSAPTFGSRGRQRWQRVVAEAAQWPSASTVCGVAFLFVFMIVFEPLGYRATWASILLIACAMAAHALNARVRLGWRVVRAIVTRLARHLVQRYVLSLFMFRLHTAHADALAEFPRIYTLPFYLGLQRYTMLVRPEIAPMPFRSATFEWEMPDGTIERRNVNDILCEHLGPRRDFFGLRPTPSPRMMGMRPRGMLFVDCGRGQKRCFTWEMPVQFV